MSSRRLPLAPDLRAIARHGRCALAIVLKAPRQGYVKTRLVPPLTPEAAAGLSRCMIRDTTENIAAACRVSHAVGVAVYTPAGAESALDPLLPDGFGRLLQRGTGFGERLANAATDLFAAGFSAVCLVDSDSPTLPTATLVDAVRQLETEGDRVVIAGADDGGYCLIGLKTPHPEVFEQIDWSTSRVRAQTEERAAAAALAVAALPVWYDVDDRASLDRLYDELLGPAGTAARPGYPAPHTRRFLATLSDERDEAGDWRLGVHADAR